MPTLTLDFSSATGWTYCSDYCEIAAGTLRLVQYLPTNSTFYHTFDSLVNWNADFAAGAAAPTAVTGAPAHNQVDQQYGVACLECWPAGGNLTFNAVAHGNFTDTWSTEFWYRPGYNGAPVGLGSQTLFFIGNAANENSMVLLSHVDPTGNLNLICADNGGVYTINQNYAWAPTLGQWYHIAISSDYTGADAVTRLFIDGTAVITTATAVNRAAGDILLFRTMANRSDALRPRAMMDAFVMAHSNYRTANFSVPLCQPGEYPGTYCCAHYTLPSMHGMTRFAATLGGIGNVRFAFRERGYHRWFNGHYWDWRPIAQADNTMLTTSAEMARAIRFYHAWTDTPQLYIALQGSETATPTVDQVVIDYY